MTAPRLSRSGSGTPEIEDLRARLAEAEDALRAIRSGEVDAVIVQGESGDQVYTLQSAEQPYRVLVEQMHEGAAILTVQGDILYCNQRFSDIVGSPIHEVTGGSVNRFLDEARREQFALLLARGAGSDHARFISSTGVARDVYCSITASVSGGVERRNLIVADLSELLDARAERDRAERENRSKDEFLAALAHELRNPLGAVAGAVEVLNLVGGDGPALRARTVIAQQVHHLSRMVDDLLDVGRVAVGKIALAPEPLDLAALVSRCIAALPGDDRQHRRVEVSAESAWVDADPTRMEQVFGNLLSNAIKYTAPGGWIHVSVAKDGPCAVLRVQDNGAGIDEDLRPRIFEPFVQGGRPLSRAPGGLGIGLTLVRRLVELHGGTVSAASDGASRGSTFEIRLPRRPAPEHGMVRAAQAGTGLRRRILIVEDNEDAGEMYRLLLEMSGHEVLVAETGTDGLELLRTARPDVALVDIGLPGLDGYEIARRFRAEPDSRRVLLVALTGYGSASDRDRSRQAGFDRHLTKPVDPEALRLLLDECV